MAEISLAGYSNAESGLTGDLAGIYIGSVSAWSSLVGAMTIRTAAAMGIFEWIAVTTATFFQSTADEYDWPTRYDNDPRPTPTAGLWMQFQIDYGESEQHEIGINSYRNPGNIVVKIMNDVGLGFGGVISEVDIVASLFRSANVSTMVFRTPRIIKVGRIGDLYQVNVICPFYVDRT